MAMILGLRLNEMALHSGEHGLSFRQAQTDSSGRILVDRRAAANLMSTDRSVRTRYLHDDPPLHPATRSPVRADRSTPRFWTVSAYDDEHPWEPARPGTTIEGTLTIGCGHTGLDVYPRLVITEPEADGLFDTDWNTAVDGVLQLLDPSIAVNGNQLGAMASLAFNIGARAFAHSYVLERFNKGDLYGASQGFSHFETSKGVRKSDLVKCRQLEAALFTSKGGGTVQSASGDTTAGLNAQELASEDGNGSH